jgi:hypothetical protein
MFFHSAGLAEGGKDNGAPGERRCHPGYYACFLLDHDGKKTSRRCSMARRSEVGF